MSQAFILYMVKNLPAVTPFTFSFFFYTIDIDYFLHFAGSLHLLLSFQFYLFVFALFLMFKKKIREKKRTTRTLTQQSCKLVPVSIRDVLNEICVLGSTPKYSCYFLNHVHLISKLMQLSILYISVYIEIHTTGCIFFM